MERFRPLHGHALRIHNWPLRHRGQYRLGATFEGQRLRGRAGALWYVVVQTNKTEGVLFALGWVGRPVLSRLLVVGTWCFFVFFRMFIILAADIESWNLHIWEFAH